MSNTSNAVHVLISGGGLSGLALAQGLHAAGVRVTVFERDPSPAFRPQGYRVRISPHGSAALRALLPQQTFDLFERTCAATVLGLSRLDALTGKLVQGGPGVPSTLITPNTAGPRGAGPGGPAAGQGPPTAGRGPPGYAPGDDKNVYTVDRTRLRAVLMHGILPLIQFGKTVKRYTIDPAAPASSRVKLEFADGSTASGSILVGADGVHSSVRRQLLPADVPKVVDTDGRAIYGKTPITHKLTAHFPADASKWMSMVVDTSDKPTGAPLTLFLEFMRFPSDSHDASLGVPQLEDYVYWVLCSRQAVFGLSDAELLSLPRDRAREFSLSLTAHWDPSVRSLLELQYPDHASALRLASVMPVLLPAGETAPQSQRAAYTLPSWEPSPCITLLGDAVHPMTPAAGQGANTALRDAATLCKHLLAALQEQGDDVSGAIGKYEAEMRLYAGAAVQDSYYGGQKIFGQRDWEECEALEMRGPSVDAVETQ